MSDAPDTDNERGARVLLVDDDAFLLRAMARLLARRHRVVTALGGASALSTLEADRAFDLVIFDMRMPGTDGGAFHASASARWPELPPRLVVMTGNVHGEGVADLRARGCRVLAKPFECDDVDALLRPR